MTTYPEYTLILPPPCPTNRDHHKPQSIHRVSNEALAGEHQETSYSCVATTIRAHHPPCSIYAVAEVCIVSLAVMREAPLVVGDFHD